MKITNAIKIVALLGILSLSAGSVLAQAPSKAQMTKNASDVDGKVKVLNDLISRIQGMKNVSDADKTSLSSTIQSLIMNMEQLKNATTSTSTANLKSILRVHALVEPEIHIIGAADRVKTVINQLTVISGKLQARLAENSAASNDASVQAAITSFTTKINDANSKVQNAVISVTSLQPDNGDKTAHGANTKALKDARAQISAAHKDLVGAKKDLQTIISVLGKVKPNNATSTSNATSTQ